MSTAEQNNSTGCRSTSKRGGRSLYLCSPWLSGDAEAAVRAKM